MEDFISTQGSRNKKNADKQLEVTTFEARRKSEKRPKVSSQKKVVKKHNSEESDFGEDEDEHNTPVDGKRKQELEMKKFRYDIMKFGMSGYDKQTAHKAKIALAVSLGAKPPKNKRKNYKKVLQQRKQEKIQEGKAKKFQSGFIKTQLTAQKPHHKKAKKSKGILGVYGKVTNKN